METFIEWANPKIKLGFSEKYNMFINRLSTLQGMKLTADSQTKTATNCCGDGRGNNPIFVIGDVATINLFSKSPDESILKGFTRTIVWTS